MANLTFSTELMQNYLHAEPISSQHKIAALQTQDGHSLLFGIDSDGVFNLVQEHSGASTAGWVSHDLASALLSKDFAGVPGAACSMFAADQSVQDQTVSLALVVTTSAGDNLYLSLGNPNTDTDTSWAAAPQWAAFPYDNPNIKLSKLSIVNAFFCEVSEGVQYTIVDVLRDPTSPVHNISRFYLDPTKPSGHAWQPHDVAVDIEAGSYSSSLGRLPGGYVDGLYTAGQAGGSGQLVFSPVVNPFGSGPPPVVRLDLPTGVLPGAIATARNPDLSTDLFVVGGSTLYYFASTNQHDSAQGVLLLTTPLLLDTTQLYAFKTDQQAYVWALNRANQVFYTTCPLAQLTQGGAWTVPMPIKTGVSSISPYVNLKNEGNTFFAVSSDGLHKMMKAPTTSLWTAQNITLPASSTTTKAQRFSAYTTRLQLTDDAHQPMANALLQVSAAVRAGFFINNLYYVLDTTPIPIPTDTTGSITIVESVQKLHATQLTVAAAGSSAVRINPMDTTMKKIASLNSAASLQSAVITPLNGSPRPLIAPGTSLQDLNTLAASNQGLGTAYAKTPASLPLRRAGAAALPGSPNSIWSDIGDLFQWLESGIEALVNIVADAATGLWHFVATIAGDVYQAVLDSVEAIVGAAEWLFNAVKTAIGDVLKYLEFLFELADIARTKAVVANLSKIFLADRINGLATIKTDLDTVIGEAETAINKWAGITDWKGLGPAAATPVTASSTPSSAATAPSSLLSYHLQYNMGAATSPATLAAPALVLAGDPIQTLLDALAAEKLVIQDVLTELTGLAEQFTTLSLTELLQKLVAILVDSALSSTQAVLDALLDVLTQVSQGVLTLLETPIYIPVLSDILSDFGVPSLSILDLFSWVAAVVGTLGYKLLNNAAPFPDNAATTLLSTAPDFQTVLKAYQSAPAALTSSATAGDAPLVDPKTLFAAGHVVGGLGAVLAGLVGTAEALSEPGENPAASYTATMFGLLSGIAVAWPDFVVRVLPLQDPVMGTLSKVVDVLSVVSPFAIFFLGKAGKLEDPRTTSAEANALLVFPKLPCTCQHFVELSEQPESSAKTQAVLEEVSNITRYLSAMAYLPAVTSVPNELMAALYGATIICSGGLLIATGEIPLS